MNMDDAVVLNAYWADEIQNAFDEHTDGNALGEELFLTGDNFLDMIWEQSITAFDKPREVQVIIDSNNNLFISFGTPGFVSFEGQEEELYGDDEEPRQPMKLPIKCWIHTHPFGAAYFSGTDWNTIRTWELLMNSAIVLGDNQRMLWTKERAQHTVFYRNGTVVEEEE
tara:strand:- start:9956 stop:10459 length:504 start_codon:yes stop_codon:yes gene_type:complete